jgi:hypothetical protein
VPDLADVRRRVADVRRGAADVGREVTDVGGLAPDVGWAVAEVGVLGRGLGHGLSSRRRTLRVAGSVERHPGE